MKRFFLKSNWPLALTILGLTAPLAAQPYEQVAPKTLPATPAPVLPEPAASAAAASVPNDRVLVSVLRGLTFLANPAALQPQGITTEGVQIAGIAMLETAEYRAIATPYLGRPLSLSALSRLIRETVLYFRKHGRPVVDVLVPEQNISTGSVQLLVVEGRVGVVRTEGNKWFTAEQISSSVRARPGEIIEGAPLLADLTWINQNPFRQVDLVYARGTHQGETDLVLRTLDRFPLRVYTGYEDSGNALTGFDRVIGGFNWADAFGRDEHLNYQLSASPDFKKMVAHSASYMIPLQAHRHTLTFFGSYAKSEPDLAGGLFTLTGRTWQIGTRYRVPFVMQDAWTRAFTAGVDFKRSNNNLSFGGTQVFAQENDVAQAILAFSASRPDRHGMSSGELTVALSPGGLTPGNRTTAYRAARSLARPGYTYARLELERLTTLPERFSWITRATAQLASANLLGSEQLGLGGASNLRGYEEREANGDDGLVLVNELHGPPLRRASTFGHAKAENQLDPLVFFDCGEVSSHARLPGEPKRLTLASFGVGFRYNLGGHFNLRADYGWQLKDSKVSDGRRHQRGHISAVLSY
jgi:hemolysin activation/secretion protein